MHGFELREQMIFIFTLMCLAFEDVFEFEQQFVRGIEQLPETKILINNSLIKLIEPVTISISERLHTFDPDGNPNTLTYATDDISNHYIWDRVEIDCQQSFLRFMIIDNEYNILYHITYLEDLHKM